MWTSSRYNSANDWIWLMTSILVLLMTSSYGEMTAEWKRKHKVRRRVWKIRRRKEKVDEKQVEDERGQCCCCFVSAHIPVRLCGHGKPKCVYSHSWYCKMFRQHLQTIVNIVMINSTVKVSRHTSSSRLGYIPVRKIKKSAWQLNKNSHIPTLPLKFCC